MESSEPASSFEKIKYRIQNYKTTRDGAMAHALCRKRGYARSMVSSQGGRWNGLDTRPPGQKHRNAGRQMSHLSQGKKLLQ